MPKLWPGETVAILGCGPSLCLEDVQYLRGKVRVIAINTAYQLAPWADVLYACDAKWWAYHKGCHGFLGRKYSLEDKSAKWLGVQVLKNTGNEGLELHPTGLRTGKNSGYQAINLAVHLGATRILLLGYDMKRVHDKEHFSNAYPPRAASPYATFLLFFKTIVTPLERLGVEVINCTPGSALKVFPRKALRDVLPETAETVDDAPLEAAL